MLIANKMAIELGGGIVEDIAGIGMVRQIENGQGSAHQMVLEQGQGKVKFLGQLHVK